MYVDEYIFSFITPINCMVALVTKIFFIHNNICVIITKFAGKNINLVLYII